MLSIQQSLYKMFLVENSNVLDIRRFENHHFQQCGGSKNF